MHPFKIIVRFCEIKFGSIFGSLPDFPSLRPQVKRERSQVALFLLCVVSPGFNMDDCLIEVTAWAVLIVSMFFHDTPLCLVESSVWIARTHSILVVSFMLFIWNSRWPPLYHLTYHTMKKWIKSYFSQKVQTHLNLSCTWIVTGQSLSKVSFFVLIRNPRWPLSECKV